MCVGRPITEFKVHFVITKYLKVKGRRMGHYVMVSLWI